MTVEMIMQVNMFKGRFHPLEDGWIPSDENESRQKHSTVSLELHFHVTNLLVRVNH
jgi:ribosome-associated toxin RatA of RatAB toxin-antitoxin module